MILLRLECSTGSLLDISQALAIVRISINLRYREQSRMTALYELSIDSGVFLKFTSDLVNRFICLARVK